MSSFFDAGLIGVYAGVNPDQTIEVLEIILTEMEKLRTTPVDPSELDAAKEHLKGGLVLSLESTDNIMTRLAKNEITYERYIHFDEIMDSIDAVTMDHLQELAEEYLRPDTLALTLLGPIESREVRPDLLVAR